MDKSETVVQGRDTDTRTFELLAPTFAQVRQERDCLYLHCREDSPKRLILGLAGGSALALRAEGIAHIKLYGNRWALGVDLPLGEAAIAAAAIAEKMATHDALQPLSFKLLLRQACLSVLCEGEREPMQAPTALAILAILRGTAGVEYLQNLVVKGRQRRQKRADWTFEVDLLALGIEAPAPTPPEPLVTAGNDTVEAFQELVAAEDILPESPPPWWQRFPLLTANPLALAIALMTTGVVVVVGDRAFQTMALPTESVPTPLVSENRLPRQNFNNATLNEKLDLVEWHRQKYRRPPDVMILGSSRALRGVDPTVLEETLAARGYPNVSILNMGINGATARVMRLQLLDILSAPQRPRMVILADGLRAFNNNREDRTYREIASSPGYQLLATQAPEATTQPAAVGFGERFVQTLLPSFRDRQRRREWLVSGYSWLTQVLSDREKTLQANFPELKVEMDTKGFLAIDELFEPESYFANRRVASGEFDSDYRNFNGTGEQMAAFYELAQFCQRQGIALVVVNLPLHETYLDETRRRYEAFFNGRMQKLATRLGFVYLNLSERWQQNSELFSDPSHLNYRGARVVSRYLGSSGAIPWNRVR
ncbi:MAG: hypothetical protein ACUVSQ_11080 [Pseudanabaenaceae cyanobacterium]